MCYSDSDTESFVNRVLTESRFSERFPVFLEKVFALGGGVIKVYYDDSAPDQGFRSEGPISLPRTVSCRQRGTPVKSPAERYAARIVSGGRRTTFSLNPRN